MKKFKQTSNLKIVLIGLLIGTIITLIIDKIKLLGDTIYHYTSGLLFRMSGGKYELYTY